MTESDESDEYPELCNANKALMTRIATEVKECKTGTDTKVDGVGQKVDGIQPKIAELKGRIGLSTDASGKESLHGKLKETNAKVGRVEQIVGRVKDEVDNIKISISELKNLFEKSRGPTLSLADKEFIDNMVLHGESDRIRVVNFLNSLNISISQASIRVKSEGDGAGFITVLPGNEGQIGVKADEINVCVMRSGQTQFGTVKISNLRKNTHAITGLQATEDITICGDSIVNENEITLFPHTLKSNNDRVKVVDIRYGYFSQYVEDVPLDEFKLGNNCRTDVEAFVQKLIQSEDRVRYLTGVLSVQGSKLVPTDPADGGGVPTPFIVVEGDVDDNLSYDGHKLHVCVVNGPDGCDTSGMVDILALRDNTTAIRTLKVGDAAINLGDPGAVANAGAVITLNRETLSLDGTVVKVEVSIIDGVQDMEIALEVLKLDKNVELGEVDKFIRDDIKRGDRIRYLTGNLTVYKVSDMKSHEEQIDAANDEDPAVLAVVMPGTEDRLVGDDRDGIAVFMLHTGGNLLRRVFVKIGELKRCTKAVGTLRVIGSGVGLAIRDGDVVALMPETLRLDGNDVVEVDVIVSTGDVDSFPVVKIDLKDLILGESAQDKNVKLNLETDQVIRDILRGGRIRFLTNKLTVYTNVDMESDDKEIDAADDTNPAVLAVVMPGAEDRLVGEHRNGIAVFLLHTDQDAVQHVFVKIDELKDATKAITEPMTVTNSAIPVSPVNSTIKFEETSLSVDNKNSAVVNVIAGRGTSADDVWTWERSVRVFNSVRLIMFQVYVSGDSVTCKIVKPPGGVELQHFN
eukprot:60610_1